MNRRIEISEIKKFFKQEQKFLHLIYDKFCTKSFCIIDRNGVLIYYLLKDSSSCPHTLKFDSYYFEFWNDKRMMERLSLQDKKGKEMADVLNPILFSLLV